MASGTCRTPFCSAAPLSLCGRRASQADIPSGRAWTSQALLTRRRGQAVSGVAQAGAPFRPRRRACAMPCRATRGAARLPSLVAAESQRSRPELRLSRAQRAMSSREVELGFAEEAVARWRLSREQFPSKVGGRPAWLGESGLPGPVELRCGVCGQPCAFLLQLYAPLPDRPDAFHRSLFLFSCRQPACYRPVGQAPGSLRVFRNQLPRKNDIYSYEPPPEEPPPEEEPCAILQLKCGMKLCKVCGCLGPKACSKCHKAYYCSKDHQVRDWKAGHKLSCTQSEKMDIEIPDHTFLFPEYEIVIEPEEMKSSNVDETEQEDLDTNKDSASADNTYEAAESLDENMLETMAKHETEDDKIFQKFKERTSLAPEQIIRYCRDGEGPIWISGENIPSETEIPNCVCGAKRVFEFQVMPQLLNYLKVDSLGESIDWGTVAIYTCADNCNLGNQYTEEFIWKQDISSSV